MAAGTFVATTNCDHQFQVHLNLASSMAFARNVVRWALKAHTLAARLTIAALEQAMAQRQPPPGLQCIIPTGA